MNDYEDLQSPGWYGKIPSLGDFITRRLPSSFIDPWDTWLQRAISLSRAQLGEQWLNLYLVCPLWRFILMPGICGNSLWMGVLMPSIDKVGRYFPLTIAAQARPHSSALFTAISAHSWYASLEQLALTSLDVNLSLEVLDQKLRHHPFPHFQPGDQSHSAQELASWWTIKPQTGLMGHKTVTLTTVDSLSGQFEAAAKNIFMTIGEGKSLWWKVSQAISMEEETTQLHCFTGLPPENCFVLLLGHDAL
ncbi:type VI secretion system-associated protein TagF [Nitrosomonas communis]|uniref:Type VI secretion system protein ImpM n=1 Tax=Nitrosomonas communis TaxID=44574 RepID=A0A1H2Z878_9PROT|nr:type VI secretion system-associated protein TagF [Nitrosomonas communis]SDX13610.1 type VI secretion system protein ImpM [Nitrosomonas communis]